MGRRAVVIALATGCIGVGGIAASVIAAQGNAEPATRAAAAPALPAPRLVLPSSADGHQPWQRPLRVSTTSGRLLAVAVTGPWGPVAGILAANVWTSTTPLVPSTAYHLAVHARAGSVTPVVALAADVRTTSAARVLHAVLSPGDNDVVGVGEPIIVTFNHEVPAGARAAVARRLHVTTTPTQPGGWFWLSPTELHWRPDVFWRPHTRVLAKLDLTALYVGGGMWGAQGGHSVRYHIGDAHVSVVDAATHQMTVTNNGRVVQVLPVSTGRDKYPTHAGVHLTLEKSPVVTMDSATVGIPRDSPDGYFEQVYWDVRISDSGEFVHAAPWSVTSQGTANVSHGCVNVSTTEAQWFYRFSLIGDVVRVVGTPAASTPWDPGTADWNRPVRALSD